MFVKLMNVDGSTKNEMIWGDGTRHEAANQTHPMKLCSNTVIHFYEDELLAVMMNPTHGDFSPCLARRFEPEGEIISDGLKSGCRAGITRQQIELPEVSLSEKIRFGILCALRVYREQGFEGWAGSWFDGTGRSRESARADAAAADAADAAAAYAAARAAAYAARADAEAAYAYAAAYYAARADAEAARAADGAKIDFIMLAHQAVTDERALQTRLQNPK